MARFTFKLPDIGEGISEAEIVAWHVAIGDRVEEDSPVADMMTDKATVEMESPVSGVVVELAGEVGDQVSIGAALVVIETDAVDAGGEVVAAPLTAAQAETAEQYEAENPGVEEVVETPTATTPAEAGAQVGGAGNDAQSVITTTSPTGPRPSPGGSDEQVAAAKAHALASPAVRARARDLGIDLASVKTESDRVRHADLDAYLRYGAGQGYQAPGASRARADQPIKVIGMRRKIAENMAASKRAIPHFTYVDEIDVTALEAMRADLNANRGGRPKLTMLPLMIVAICKTIPDFPMLNARYDDEAGVVTRHGAIHLGMAAQTDAGLTVPVIRDAQDRNVWQLATEITRLAEAARAGKLAPNEMGGGTITVTSLGPLGGIATTPVINRPEVAIIGPNKIVERPVFKGDEVVRAKLMNLSISCDHRVVDGWDAASFVQGLKKYLETPVLLFAD
ncbi:MULTISPECIES: dihydrolipoamide acetyltransferase family protein [Sphingomonas]|uniref:dihydrolipoamide acetyltransferase family protein n=1 Tax=Sphingomonas TaxID=13687 RepID=UPI0007020978|nr:MULTISPECIES: dihydrolipoamide acetyltransferase family protein [Sphingomonas]KQM91260.1 branched-chain alpha-keto acid dehydrogenase subunit E2 [Sphingomonas sp. Leaf226]MDY0966263.1 dihydrolipoamide acetyltransferase family protein [Sphingomonas sp. CFBP9021]USQ99932.1 2-oxo acid dehydrogenase subunit E2 [Sphingomonas aerolata]